MNNYIYIAVMALVSYTIRILPLTLIRKPIRNRFIQSFLYYVPYVTLAVSAVDTATESGIRRALAELTDVTKLIIAQRISSVQSADLIVILEDGRLHAVGTHAELLEKDTIYQEIYYSQMKGGDPDGE